MVAAIELSPKESAFLEAINRWMSKPGATAYLIGSESGGLTLDIDCKRFNKCPEHTMSRTLRDALLNKGVMDGRASAHQTHRFLKGVSECPLQSDRLKNTTEAISGPDDGPGVA